MIRSFKILVFKIFVLSFVFIPTYSFAILDEDLTLGSKGAKVIELQKFLIEKGFLKGSATGSFFFLTKRAVSEFQKSVGLPQTGYVGPKTRVLINAKSKDIKSDQKSPNTSIVAPTIDTNSTSSKTNKFLNIGAVKNTNTEDNYVFSLDQTPFYVGFSDWEFSRGSFQSNATRTPTTKNFINPVLVSEKKIDRNVVVYVRCKYIPYSTDGKRDWSVSVSPVVGSGVIVSPDGHILTAAHILRISDYDENDGTRKWKIDKCDVALTSPELAPIHYDDEEVFYPAEIVYSPSEEEYNLSKDFDRYNPKREIKVGSTYMDAAILKINKTNLPYAPLVSKLLALKHKDPLLGIGYPGKDVDIAQHLERIDGVFHGYTWRNVSLCATKEVVENCGIRYQIKRYKEDFKKLMEKGTELGKYTSFLRGGFSGAPVFYKGNLVGIIVAGPDNPYSDLYDFSIVGQWNWAEVVSSQEIVHILKSKGINLPTIP